MSSHENHENSRTTCLSIQYQVVTAAHPNNINVEYMKKKKKRWQDENKRTMKAHTHTFVLNSLAEHVFLCLYIKIQDESTRKLFLQPSSTTTTMKSSTYKYTRMHTPI